MSSVKKTSIIDSSAASYIEKMQQQRAKERQKTNEIVNGGSATDVVNQSSVVKLSEQAKKLNTASTSTGHSSEESTNDSQAQQNKQSQIEQARVKKYVEVQNY